MPTLQPLQQQHEASLQNQEDFAHNNVEYQPAMVQEGMDWSEDTLSTSSSSSLASVVTFSDLQKQLDKEIASQEDRSSPRVSSQQAPHMMDYLAPPYLPSYAMTSTKNEASSSQQQFSPSEHNYWNNWNTMEKYFQEDSSMPVPKRLRLNEVELNTDTTAVRDVTVIEPSVTLIEHPHQWFNGQSSSAEVQGKDHATHSNN